MVEFALIFPILVFLIFGIIEAALIMQGHLAVQHGAREAARFATTNQPIQGTCMDRDRDGQIEDGFGEGDPGDLAGYPYCPLDRAANPSESDEDYYRRRVALIRLEAQKAAVGLRTIKGGGEEDPGYFSIGVWGYPSIDADCNNLMDKDWDPDDEEPGCRNFPGLKGLPVLVVIWHNVDVIDPILSAVADYVTVEGQAQMINEGVQGEKGDLIPAFTKSPDPDWGETVTETESPEEPLPPSEVITTPKEYFLDLSPEISQNDLSAADRSHVFIATVTDEEEKPWSGIQVKFHTNEGGFSYSGTGPRDAKITTNAAGQASVTLYGKRPDTTARLEAWLDYNGDGAWNAGEPGDRATKNWVATGPYITVEPGHKVIPLQRITIDVMDHPITDTDSYSLLWCFDSGGITDTSTIVQDPVTVDAGGDATGLEFTIPEGSEGLFYLETHPSGSGIGDCGPGGRVAYTDILVTNTPPDLKISIAPPATVCPETTFVLPANIINDSDGGTDDAFDVDFDVNPASSPPENPIGVTKQWVAGIKPNQTKAMTTVMWLDSPGEHVLWGRVDTSNNIEELEPNGESNNTYSVTLTTDPASASRPTNNTALSGGDGDGFERNPGNAYADGGSFAKSLNTGNGGDPDRHEYSGFDFDIPETIDVQDMEVRLDWWLDEAGGDNRIGVQLFCDGGWTSVKWTSNEPTAENTVILDGWDRTCVRDDLNNGNFRVRLSLESSESDRDFFLDWVAVRVIGSSDFGCDEWPESSPWIDDSKPPGLEECYQLLDFGDFESDPSPWPEYWYDYWNTPEEDSVLLVYKNSLAVRLFASYSLEPCTLFHPYLHQKVEVPDEIDPTMTTMHVRGQYAVEGSAEGSSCSTPGPEEDDVLSLQMRDGSGNPIPDASVQIADGYEAVGWKSFEEDMTSRVNLPERAGQEMEVYLEATADGAAYPYDDEGTWFYLDNLECEVCTEWPVPEYEEGTASIGGRVLGDFTARFGIDVWAYGQTFEGGGAIYHTVTLQDGSYRFYNIEPGIYTIDAQIWLDPMTPRFGTRTVTANACNFENEGECNFEVNLLLWWSE